MVRNKINFQKSFLEYGVDEKLAEAAASVLERGEVVLLATTGKLASGKDTIAPIVMEQLVNEGGEVFHLSFAAALKDEVNEVIGVIRSVERDCRFNLSQILSFRGLSFRKAMAADLISSVFGIDVVKARFMVATLYEVVNSNLELTSRDRTKEIRTALQYWGSDVRREIDYLWWVKLSVMAAAKKIAAGVNIMITDVRFPNEVEACQKIGFLAIRLNVTDTTQRDRLFARDGLEPDPAALTHVSETALDEFEGFDIVLDNNGSIADCLTAVMAAIENVKK